MDRLGFGINTVNTVFLVCKCCIYTIQPYWFSALISMEIYWRCKQFCLFQRCNRNKSI